jgi:2-methylcitrate dehydratase
MTAVERLARFAVNASFEELSETAREQLKIRVLDTLGCAIGALDGEPVRAIRKVLQQSCRAGDCGLIAGGYADASWAALFNGALARYLDFNDSYLAKGETCHPSDNVPAILAAAEAAGCDNARNFITALAVAYQVQCRLSDVAPVRAAGFDHTVQGSYAVAAGVARMLKLSEHEAANAIAISGTALNALRVTRTGRLSHWKGLAYPYMASCAMRIVLLAHAGITGPLEVFEGEKGLMDAITGLFEIDWAREDLERAKHTILKKYDAEVHAQTAIDGVLELKRRHKVAAGDVEHVEVEIFDVGYNVIGGGEEGDKTSAIETKEQADHSLPYIVAVAILDGQVMPQQYEPERIRRPDVQRMLRRITVTPSASYSERFPNEMPCRIRMCLHDGRVVTKEARDYPGFLSQPMSWDTVFQKFERLTEPYTTPEQRTAIAGTIHELEDAKVADLTRLLASVGGPETRRGGTSLPGNLGPKSERGGGS